MLETALQYSGGKDSRVVLHMYKDRLKDILVVWSNAGAAYPEVEKEIMELGSQLPHFLAVRGNQPENIQQNGYPTDILPLKYSPLGRQYIAGDRIKLQSTFSCCNANIWAPLHEAMQMLGIKTIIRGQRDTDEYRNPAFRDGMVVEGIKCVAPIQDWTEAQVWDYIRANNITTPDYYNNELTGRDCWNCTGYLHHNMQRITNLRPDRKVEVMGRLRQINEAIKAEADPLHQILQAA